MDKQVETTVFRAKSLKEIQDPPDSTMKIKSYLEPGVKLSSAIGRFEPSRGLAVSQDPNEVVNHLEKGLRADRGENQKILNVVS
jgi:hypothetical protein